MNDFSASIFSINQSPIRLLSGKVSTVSLCAVDTFSFSLDWCDGERLEPPKTIFTIKKQLLYRLPTKKNMAMFEMCLTLTIKTSNNEINSITVNLVFILNKIVLFCHTFLLELNQTRFVVTQRSCC